MRGGFTTEDGTAVKPASLSSSIPSGKSTAQMFIRSAIASLTRLTTNSRVARMMRTVSLSVPSALSSIPSATIGGSWLKQLKNENGAAFGTPF